MRSPTRLMRPRLMRFGVWLATSSLCLTAVLPAAAQPAAPPGAEQAGAEQAGAEQAGADQAGAEQAGDANTDPPALAGRVASLTGSVSFHTADETQWSAATLNYPVTNGEDFWTEAQAQATLEIADDRMVLAGSTELDVTALDQAQFTTTAAQGAVFLQLNSLPQGQNVTINTPRGAVQITQPGRYEIVAGDTNDATAVTVVDGAAHVSGAGLSLDVGPQQTATIGGSDTLQGSVGPIQTDAFLQGLLRAPARRAFAAGVPAQVQYMTGASDLQTYGSFSQTAQYGQVWYPQSVPANWAPYREGHWAYVHPWGWTWVDNERWGFAPFHYGRWVQVENRWGWVPGGGEVAVGSPYPVYSPALVTFVDVAGAALASASIGFGGGYAPAWIPLGPREPYYPWYHCRPGYFDRLNAPYGVPRTIIDRGPTYNTYIRNTTVNNVTRNVFINERAATVVPAAVFTSGRPIGRAFRPVPAAALARARPFVGRQALAPTAETPNLTRVAARRFDIARPAAPARAAAGPRIEPAVDRPHGAPALRRASLPPSVHTVPATAVRTGAPVPGANARGEPVRPGQARPGEAAPRGQPNAGALRPDGARPDGLPALRSPGAARPDARARPDQPGGKPEQRAPGANPRDARPAIEQHGGRPANEAEPVVRPGDTPRRPGEAVRPEPGAARPGRPDAVQPRAVSPVHVEPRQEAGPARRGEPARPEPAHSQASRPEPARPGPARSEPARPGPARSELVRPEPARAEPPRREPARPQAVRPAPRAEAPRPHAEAPRPAPRPEAPRPAPRPEPPRAAPAPRAEAPRPAPRA